ncbi:MAG: prolipoprotein diacylglyceryl transferase [Desulfobacterales bacterium]
MISGVFKIHTYGFFIALAVLAGMFVSGMKPGAWELTRQSRGCVFLCGGGRHCRPRLFYVLTNIDVFVSAPLDVFKIWNGGLVFYGGFDGVAAVVISYLRIHRLPLGKMSDIGAVALPLGHTLGRIGQFFRRMLLLRKNVQSPMGVVFRQRTHWPPLYVHHLTQLYSSASNFLIFLPLCPASAQAV